MKIRQMMIHCISIMKWEIKALALLAIANFPLAVVGVGPSGYTFALIPKNAKSIWHQTAGAGCINQAKNLNNVTCRFVGPTAVDPSGQEQAKIIDDLIDEGTVDGISISVLNASAVIEPISRAIDAGISVVTYDSDAVESRRQTYIGTDNDAFGDRLAQMLLRIDPLGGRYVLVASESPNIVQRASSLRVSLSGTAWTELNGGSSTIMVEGSNASLTLARMAEVAAEYPYPRLGAIIPLISSVMLHDDWYDLVDANRNLTFVGVDMLPGQLVRLERDYVSGLVGQHPYEMGQLSVNTLYDLRQRPENEVSDLIVGTALTEAIRVPLVLPPLKVDMNYIGRLRIVGLSFFSIVAMSSLGLAFWTVLCRKNRIVRASQPPFLLLICFGTLIFGSAIVPMGIDDQNATVKDASNACMSTVWLVSVGFCVIFSALASKTWRVNRIFHNPNRFQRVKVTAKDVALPFVLLLTANIVVLTCWELLAPLEYVRLTHMGTDPWDRPISRYGVCMETTGRTGGAVPYLTCLGVINFGALIMANVQAYRARNIETEFSESKYIALVMISMLQVGMIIVPLAILLQESPKPLYVLQVIVIFLLSMGILVMIFVPKLIAYARWRSKQKEKTAEKARKAAAESREGGTLRGAKSMDRNPVSEGEQGLKVSVRVKQNLEANLPQRLEA